MNRRAILGLHKWSGLAAALLLLLQAATGAMLVYRAELAQLLDPAGMVRRTQGPSLPVETLARSAQSAAPGLGLNRIDFPARSSGTLLMRFEHNGQQRYVSVDPGDGRVLRAGGVWAFPTEAALRIHYQLMTGAPGTAVISITGCVLLIMAASGLLYWRPRKASATLAALRVVWSARWDVVLRQLHRTIGVLANLVLCLSAATGLWLAIPMLDDAPAAQQQHPSIEGLDRAIALARGTFPGRDVRDVRLDSLGRATVTLRAPERSARAVHKAVITLASGEIAATTPASKDTSAWLIPLPIHTGDALGNAGRLVILAGAASLIFLAIAGPTLWLAAELRRRASARKVDHEPELTTGRGFAMRCSPAGARHRLPLERVEVNAVRRPPEDDLPISGQIVGSSHLLISRNLRQRNVDYALGKFSCTIAPRTSRCAAAFRSRSHGMLC